MEIFYGLSESQLRELFLEANYSPERTEELIGQYDTIKTSSVSPIIGGFYRDNEEEVNEWVERMSDEWTKMESDISILARITDNDTNVLEVFKNNFERYRKESSEFLDKVIRIIKKRK